jgi:hypothetical protein
VSNTDGYRAVAAAVLTGDGAAASRAADALLRPATETMVGFLDAYQDEPSEDDEGEAR